MTNAQGNGTTGVLWMAMELSQGKWELAFTDLKKDRRGSVDAWACADFARALDKAKRHFGLAADCRVRSCYEAGREGFSIHRFLESLGIENCVVDPASIEVSRRKRRRKTDRLDAKK